MQQLSIIENKIDLGFAVMELIDDWYVRSYYKCDVLIDLPKAKLFVDALGKLTRKRSLPHLFIALSGVEPDIEVRMHGKTEDANRYHSALALVVDEGNLAHRILGNFVVNFEKRPRPTRMFGKEEKAVAWLKKFKNT